jgi:hypothetical protein
MPIMSNLTQTTVGYYNIERTLDDPGDIKVHTFEPGAIIKARNKQSQLLIDIEGDKFEPWLHSIFIDGQEFNVINRVSKYLGKVDEDLETREGSEEESVPKGKGKHPSKKSKVSKGPKEDRCG